MLPYIFVWALTGSTQKEQETLATMLNFIQRNIYFVFFIFLILWTSICSDAERLFHKRDHSDLQSPNQQQAEPITDSITAEMFLSRYGFLKPVYWEETLLENQEETDFTFLDLIDFNIEEGASTPHSRNTNHNSQNDQKLLDPQFISALRDFQKLSGLPVTGVFDEATKEAMNKPRCGVPDKEVEVGIEKLDDFEIESLAENFGDDQVQVMEDETFGSENVGVEILDKQFKRSDSNSSEDNYQNFNYTNNNFNKLSKFANSKFTGIFKPTGADSSFDDSTNKIPKETKGFPQQTTEISYLNMFYIKNLTTTFENDTSYNSLYNGSSLYKKGLLNLKNISDTDLETNRNLTYDLDPFDNNTDILAGRMNKTDTEGLSLNKSSKSNIKIAVFKHFITDYMNTSFANNGIPNYVGNASSYFDKNYNFTDIVPDSKTTMNKSDRLDNDISNMEYPESKHIQNNSTYNNSEKNVIFENETAIDNFDNVNNFSEEALFRFTNIVLNFTNNLSPIANNILQDNETYKSKTFNYDDADSYIKFPSEANFTFTHSFEVRNNIQSKTQHENKINSTADASNFDFMKKANHKYLTIFDLINKDSTTKNVTQNLNKMANKNSTLGHLNVEDFANETNSNSNPNYNHITPNSTGENMHQNLYTMAYDTTESSTFDNVHFENFTHETTSSVITNVDAILNDPAVETRNQAIGKKDTETTEMVQNRISARKKRHLATLASKSRARSRRDTGGHVAFSKTVLKWRLIGEGYSSQLSVEEQRYVFRLAFRMWSEVCPLEFTEDNRLPLEEIDIRLGFGTGRHLGCKQRFDGTGREFAHAWFLGDIHFDDDEHFTGPSTERGISLLKVAVHEIGHVLGLPHIYRPGSIMQPSYRPHESGFEMDWMDRKAIQNLYGSCKGRFNTVFDWVRRERTPRGEIVIRFNTYFMRQGWYWLYENRNNRSRFGDPVSLQSGWRGLPLDGVDAFVHVWSHRRDHVYFFKGTQFWRYDSEQDQVFRRDPDGGSYPRPISEGFPGVHAPIDTAVYDRRDGNIYFFKNKLVYAFNVDSNCLARGYPRPLRSVFPPLHPQDHPESSLDAAYFSYTHNALFLFKDTYFWRVAGVRERRSKPHIRKNTLLPHQEIDEQWFDICNVHPTALKLNP